MISEETKLTIDDVMIYELLETLRRFSSCKDKQVAAASTDSMGRVISVAYNEPQYECDQCEGSPHPANCARHAEKGLQLVPNCSVYITTFPCKDCQMYLWSAGVGRVYVFGLQHKEDIGLLDITLLPDVASILTNFNGSKKQKTVVMGELGELITAIADTERKDTKDNRDLHGEIVDVELQMKCLRRAIDNVDLTKDKCNKYNDLIRKFK